MIGGLVGLVIGVVVIGAVAQAIAKEAASQRTADLAAVAAGRVMHANYGRLFEPAIVDGEPNPAHLEKEEYLGLGRTAAIAVARANHEPDVKVSFPDEATIAPVRVQVAVTDRREHHTATAQAALGIAATTTFATGDGYTGELAYRQGKPMRPDVAQAFDRMERAANADGVQLVINSAYRSDAEQAVLFAKHPDPKWVARPGTSLHRNGTELDLGPPSAIPWLQSHANGFHFIQRYSWENWHWGFTLNPASSPAVHAANNDGSDGDSDVSHGAVPGFVPAQYAPILRSAAQRWNVSATLLAAQLYQESGFNPFAVSGAGAQGIAQFMPATARGMGLENPFDPEQAIDAQAHLMRDLIRQFGAVPLALAAYNAGPKPVQDCGCVPAIPETQGYVARILGLMGGAGQPIISGDGNLLEVRLVQ